MIIFGIFTGLKVTTNIVPLFKKAIAWKISKKKNHKQAVQARNRSEKLENFGCKNRQHYFKISRLSTYAWLMYIADALR